MDEEKKKQEASQETLQDDEKKPEDQQNSDGQTEKDGTEKQGQSSSNEAKKKELEKLLKQMKNLEKKQKAQSPKGPRMVKIEFGSVFHPNPVFNALMYYLLNLVVIYSLIESFQFVRFQGNLITLLLFVLLYTGVEMMFRQYLVFNHFKFVLRTFGFIFFFGYLIIFYLLDTYIFTEIYFENETLLIIFVGMFIAFRYLLAQLIKQMLFKMKG